MRLGVWLPLLCWAAAAPLWAAHPDEVREQIKETRQNLNRVRRRLQQGQQDLQRQQRQEQSLMGRLEELNRSLEAQRRAAKAQVKNLSLVQDRLIRTEARLKELAAAEAASRVSLGRSLAVLYKTRGRSGAALLFSARSPAELGARVRYLSELSAATLRGMRELQEKIRHVSEYREDYARRHEELKREKEEAEQQRRKVEAERLKRLALLKSVRSQKARTAEAVKELERAFGRLQGLLGKLRDEADRLARQNRAPSPSPSGGPSRLHRGLEWPVRGRLLSRYGRQQHPVFRTPVFNRGIEIAAPHGTPVQAVAAGTVLFAGAMEGFGDLVVLDHGGGMMSVYGYNSALRVRAGQGVAQGDVIAEVGENGASDRPALYFEIRRGAVAVDPLSYLRSR